LENCVHIWMTGLQRGGGCAVVFDGLLVRRVGPPKSTQINIRIYQTRPSRSHHCIVNQTYPRTPSKNERSRSSNACPLCQMTELQSLKGVSVGVISCARNVAVVLFCMVPNPVIVQKLAVRSSTSVGPHRCANSYHSSALNCVISVRRI
jgi:hypothetical protein